MFVFQSTLPSQGATSYRVRRKNNTRISIHAPLTGSDYICGQHGYTWIISIHAPLTGSDAGSDASVVQWEISIHAPHTGSDRRHTATSTSYRHFNPRSPHRERPSLLSVMKPCCLFQSTLPSQGATYVKISVFATHLFQSTLPSQGATIALANTLSAPFDFNPRSPHRERLCILVLRRIALVFQSTLPSQGATGCAGTLQQPFKYFNPRSPHRERLRRA